MSNRTRSLLDAMRMLWRGRGDTSDLITSWYGPLPDPATGGAMDDVELLKHRIEDLLADNDRMATELWAANVAIRVLAERVSELEEQ